MIIRFEDPGLPWWVMLIALAATVGLLLVLLIAYQVSRLGKPERHKDAKDWGWLYYTRNTLLVLSCVVSPLLGLAAVFIVYDDNVSSLKIQEAAKAGLSNIEWDNSYSETDAFTAEAEDGTLFLGAFYNLHPVRDHSYLIQEFDR